MPRSAATRPSTWATRLRWRPTRPRPRRTAPRRTSRSPRATRPSRTRIRHLPSRMTSPPATQAEAAGPGPMTRFRGPGRDLVAGTLAIGLATAVNAITLAVMYDAVRSDTPGLSENATQILTTAFGGIIGILGGYLGFKAGERAGANGAGTAPVPAPPDPSAADQAGQG